MCEVETSVKSSKMNLPLSFRQTISNPRGVTLVELVMIIVLLGILAVSVVPKFMDMSAFKLEGGAAMVVADIRYTQELAMSTHSSKTIDFPNVAGGADYYTVNSQTVNLPSKVIIPNGNGATFNFNPLGEPVGGGGSVTIEAGGNQKIITVQDDTGQVSIP